MSKRSRYIPPRPTGSSEQARFMQWVYDELAKRLVFIDSSTVKVSETTKGIAFEAASKTTGIEMTVCVNGVPTTYIVSAVKKA